MQIKKAKWVIKGMNRDLSSSKFNAEYAYENMNLRLTPMDENSLLAMVNEKGPKKLVGINGIPIGETTIGDSLIIFTTNSTGEIETYMDAGTKEYYIPEDPNIKTYIDDINNAKDDYIYKAYVGGDGNYKVDELYHGDLNFNTNSPIEALSVYENEDIQKVYWVDGRNQPRLINVARDNTKFSNSHFNFIRNLSKVPTIWVGRIENANGNFPSGVIQYVCTYYDRYAQETNIIYHSPLLYISFTDRGASPEEKVSCGFRLAFSDIDTSFDCIRIYSIIRTSLDATPICKRVVDLNIDSSKSKFDYIDNGTTGDVIDPTELLYKGGEEIIASTIAQKDNTLFLGNYSMKRKSLSAIKKYFKEKIRPATNSSGALKYRVKFYYDRTWYSKLNALGYYPYSNQLESDSQYITSFKFMETYRFGVQFLHKSGVWSEPVWLGDFKNDNCPPKQDEFGSLMHRGSYISKSYGDYYLNSTYLFNELQSEGYIAARPLVVFPDINDREVICQGVLNPTVYNLEDRYGNSPFAQSSWFFRPYAPISVEDGKEYKIISADTTNGYSLSNVVVSNSVTTANNKKYQMSNRGTWVEFRNDMNLGASNASTPGNEKSIYPRRFGEIQSLSGGCPNPYAYIDDPDKYVSDHKDSYYVDQSIVTIHSPEIEFDDQIQHIDSNNLKLRIVGMVPFTSCKGDIDIETSTPQQAFTTGDATKLDLPIGFYKEPVGVTTYLPGGNPNLDHSNYEYLYGWKMLAAGAFWFDQLYDQDYNKIFDEDKNAGVTTAFVIYPWHRNGSLNNQNRAITDKDKDLKDYRYSMLKKKRLSNFRTSFFTQYFTGSMIWEAYKSGSNTNTGISGFRIFNSNEVSLVRLPAPKNSNLADINYYGNIDKIIKHNYRSGDGNAGKGYPIMITGMGVFSKSKTEIKTAYLQNTAHDLFNGGHRNIQYPELQIGNHTYAREVNSEENTYGIDPIRMKYKSSIHGVLALNYATNSYKRVLPRKGNINRDTMELGEIGTTGYRFAWDANCRGVSQDSIELGTTVSDYTRMDYYGFLWMGEIYRDANSISNRFGGDTEEALENNKWVIAGPISELNTDNQKINSDGEAFVCQLCFAYGDTYYQRYDHIKTYPFTTEDQNQILEILSFMCESRINLDGRYDKNRGQVDNFSLTPTNMNLMNPVYSQKNNFFTYRTFNEDKLQLDDFHNSITWTKTKTAGELVDSWTNVTLASTMDFDGDKGNITALRKWNNNLLAFQNKAISQILYNENTQISTTEGVPIEIANSGKVQGKRYITDNIGCSNKWSISVTPTGIYFIDNITKALYLFNGSIGNVSDSKGFHSWFNDNAKGLQAWKPNKFNNLATYYDYINRELFIIGKNSALVYSDLVNDFTSFYNYENSPYFINLNNDGVWTSQVNNGKYNKQGQYYLWQHQKGEYNNFFGAYYPFYTTVVANDNPDDDKIFNNLEFESDSYDTSNNLTKDTFDYLEAWTEYQKGVHSLSLKGLSLKIAGIRSDDSIKHASSLKKKFRVWRANIPRNNTGINGVEPNKRDRIRNTWAYIKLMRKNEDEDNNKNNQKTILHNMIIDYLG